MECTECAYQWKEPWEDFPTCHYEGPSHWSPCEQADEDERRRIEEEDYRREIESMYED